jgi:membrane protease subunit (stomatin/prohibitin family)
MQATVVAVVKYSGGPDLLVWRFPNEGVGTWTKLLVNESQEALLVWNKQVFDVFPAGQHELIPENIPSLNAALNLPVGIKAPLPVEIWYINKAVPLEIKWGTPAPVDVFDQKYQVSIPMRALGQFTIQVTDPALFMRNLIGVLPALDKDALVTHFRKMLLELLSDNVVSFLTQKEISILELHSHLNELSDRLQEQYQPIPTSCGLAMTVFRLNNIKLSEDSPVVRQIQEAQARKAVTDLVGSQYIAPVSSPPVNASAPRPLHSHAPVPVHTQPHMPAQIYAPPIPKTCPVCYYDLDESLDACAECGYVIKKAEPTPVASAVQEPGLAVQQDPAMIKCIECGTQLRDTQKFCHECGYKP